jgi:hypothetical protein
MSNYGRQRWLDCGQSLTLDVPYNKAKLTGRRYRHSLSRWPVSAGPVERVVGPHVPSTSQVMFLPF